MVKNYDTKNNDIFIGIDVSIGAGTRAIIKINVSINIVACAGTCTDIVIIICHSATINIVVSIDVITSTCTCVIIVVSHCTTVNIVISINITTCTSACINIIVIVGYCATLYVIISIGYTTAVYVIVIIVVGNRATIDIVIGYSATLNIVISINIGTITVYGRQTGASAIASTGICCIDTAGTITSAISIHQSFRIITTLIN